MGGFGNVGAIVILVAISMFGIGMANKNFSSDWNGNWNHTSGGPYGQWNQSGGWPYGQWNQSGGWPYGQWNQSGGWPYGQWNHTQSTPKIITVGGSENWRFGFNYTDWAIRNGPFYLNDKLVFRFDPPNDTTFPHSVYLLPNYWSFQNCDLRRARKIAEVTQGGGEGFEFELKRWQPYYFACGERNGFHCNNGTMKFTIWPLIRWY